MTGDESYHAHCFTCRTCKRRIEELVFAKTSQGIYCMVSTITSTSTSTSPSFSHSPLSNQVARADIFRLVTTSASRNRDVTPRPSVNERRERRGKRRKSVVATRVSVCNRPLSRPVRLETTSWPLLLPTAALRPAHPRRPRQTLSILAISPTTRLRRSEAHPSCRMRRGVTKTRPWTSRCRCRYLEHHRQ
jgi:hypothetical protein